MRHTLPIGKLSRREILRRGLLGIAGLSLGDTGRLLAATSPRQRPIPAKPHARSVIQIWMWGGPSHLDTFDPKPDAGRDFCGPLDQALKTNVAGIRINPLLPELAKCADRYSIIRSMTHGVNSHETASYLVQTGHPLEHGLVHPSVGAVVSLHKGYDKGYKGRVPPYVVLTSPQGRFSEAGFIGNAYAPFSTGSDPNRDRFEVEGIVLEGISPERLDQRRRLLHDLDTLGRSQPGLPAFREFDNLEAPSYEMIKNAGDVFDLTHEKDSLRDRYGRTTFGQSCLVARRLVEHGVPYITINYHGWDTHKIHFQTMQRKLPEMDNGMATLIQDLNDRGLLESTIIWWSGEFGRTPRVQWEAPWNGGRGHHGSCFSALLAGGGFAGGHVIGATDERGETVADRPVYPRDLLASLYTRLGIDPDGILSNNKGLHVPVLPPADATDSSATLTEIM